MKVLVTEVPEEGQELDFTLDLVFPEKDRPMLFEKAVASSHVRLLKFSKGVFVEGGIDISCSLICHRCLDPFDFHIHEDVGVVFMLEEIVAGMEEVMLSRTDLDVEFFDGNIVDLGAWLESIVISAIPLKALCIEDCKGLCSVCGANLNVESCTCSHDLSYSPFRALKNVFSE